MAKYLNEWSNTPGSNNFATPDGAPEGITSNKLNDIIREQMAVLSRWEKDNNGSVGTAGTQPAYTATLNQTAIAAYYDGLRVCLDFHAANAGGAPTLDLNSIGSAKALVWPDGTALATNDITIDMKLDLLYDGTSFQVLSPQGEASAAALNIITTRGDVIRGDSTGAAERLALGAADTALLSDGTDVAYGGIIKQGLQSFWVPATAMLSRTTSGAAVGTAETATNKVMIATLDFDASTDEFAQFVVQMPKSWDAGTVTAAFVWSHAAATTFGVRFFIQGLSSANDDALDTAFGTAVGHTADAGGTTNDLYISPTTGAVTIAGAGKSEYVTFQIFRDVSDAGDTLDVDARLHGVTIHYTVDAASDT